MKRWIKSIAAVTLIATVLAGCSSNGTTGSKEAGTTDSKNAGTEVTAQPKATIKFMTFTADLKEGLDKVKKDFEAQNPNITIDISYVPGDQYNSVLKTKFSTNDAPDIFATWAMNDYINAGYLMPLDDLNVGKKMTKAGKEIIAAQSKDGKLYGVPAGLAPVGIIANKAVLDKAGITSMPKNYKEFLEACEKIKAAGIAPIAYTDKDGVESQQFAGWGADALMNEQEAKDIGAGNKKASESEAIKVTFQRLKELKDKGYFVEGWQGLTLNQGETLLGQGKAAFLANGEWSIASIKKVDPNVNLVMFPMPFANDGQSRASVTDVFNIAASKDTKVKEAVIKFFDYMTTDNFPTNFGLPYATPIEGLKQQTSKEDQAYFTTYKDFLGAEQFIKFNFPLNYDQLRRNAVQDFLAGKPLDKALADVDAGFKK